MHFNEKLPGGICGEVFKLPLVLVQGQCETGRISPEIGLEVDKPKPH